MKTEISEKAKQAFKTLQEEFPSCLIAYVDGDTVATTGEMETEQVKVLIDMLETAIMRTKPNMN